MMCTICNELLGISKDNRFVVSNKFNMKNAFLAQDQYFSLIPSVGALSNGHCLIVPNTHCNSIFKYAGEGGLLSELKQFLAGAYDKLITEEDVDLLCFEHGSYSDEANYSLCSTSHAHLHVVPIQREKITPIVAKVEGLPEAGINDLAGLVKKTSQFTDYITIFTFQAETINNCKILNALEKPSQYIRKVIGEELENKNWNWKTSQNNDFTDETIASYFLRKEPVISY